MDPQQQKEQHTPHVVIVGGGFAGLYAARELAGARVRITLVDRRNHHLFQPLLYQVATAALSPADIAEPIRHVLSRQRNVRTLLAEAAAIEPEQRRLRLADGYALDYDYLVVAAGATHSYFGHDEWARFAPGLKTLEDALEIRRRVLTAFERAEADPDRQRREALLTFVVVGGGPTGVELAGALAEIARFTIPRDFRTVSTERARVILIEGSERVLPALPPSLSAAAQRDLERLGVQVWTGKRVTGIDPRGVQVGEERVAARTVLWAAGVAGAPLARTLGVPLDPAGRVPVNADLTVPGHEEIYVVGDLALARDKHGAAIPGVAPAAIQQGRHAGRNLLATLRGRPRKPFAYFDKGVMATVGRGHAVAGFWRIRISGYLAWLAWLFIHIWFLIDFRNRASVLFQWFWHYLTFKRGARLILETPEEIRFRAVAGVAPPDVDAWPPNESDAERPRD
ncbi:NAD(P)/FAD-dependent oxidoreductase [Anaeromyxobacter dehalogenans]|uniref:FAD-dependent pyridine nucleotide-disulfide oxidoreductase n=1 Tax=Anaeromyxobacter dehalogenans (strain 2CP-C) TaxID=290397 RepID=Q2IJU3_ANADE|nr:NAD(P)/FAD-dependent oxidoreductase [Anaeromyxobacter dehalogenans]ABC81923.1 FAD-dependent pyridine nucleotide-disulfide oxidoreductase [Anaeromyxobacter dehalogenans 2CP-C]